MTFEKLLQQSLIWRGFYFITLLLVNVVLSRYLQADNWGWINYITGFSFSLILTIASLSMESGFTYFSSGNIINYNKLARFAVLWTITIAILVSIGVGLYFDFSVDDGGFARNTYRWYALCYVCGILFTNFFMVLFYAQKNFVLPNLLMGILNLILLTVVVMQHEQHKNIWILIDTFFLFYLLQGIVMAIAFIGIKKSFSSISLPNAKEMKLLFRYSLVALIGNLLYLFMYKIDYWFVRHYEFKHNPADLGNYTQASKLAQMALIIPQILASVIFPQIAGGDDLSTIGKSIMTLFRVLLQVFIIAFIVVLSIGDKLFPFVFGSSYNNVQMPFLILLPGIFSMSITVLLTAFFSGIGKVKLNGFGTGIGLVVVTVACCLLVPEYGIIGAAIASSLGYSAFLLYCLYHFRKVYSFGIKDMFAFAKTDWLWVKNVLTNKK